MDVALFLCPEQLSIENIGNMVTVQILFDTSFNVIEFRNQNIFGDQFKRIASVTKDDFF